MSEPPTWLIFHLKRGWWAMGFSVQAALRVLCASSLQEVKTSYIGCFQVGRAAWLQASEAFAKVIWKLKEWPNQWSVWNHIWFKTFFRGCSDGGCRTATSNKAPIYQWSDGNRFWWKKMSNPSPWQRFDLTPVWCFPKDDFLSVSRVLTCLPIWYSWVKQLSHPRCHARPMFYPVSGAQHPDPTPHLPWMDAVLAH